MRILHQYPSRREQGRFFDPFLNKGCLWFMTMLVHGNTGSEFLTTCDLMLKEKCDIPYVIKQGCSCVPCVIVS